MRVLAVSFDEPSGKATLRIDTDGEVEAQITTEFRFGNEWIVIALTPVANDPTPLLPHLASKQFGAIEAKLSGHDLTLALELLAERIDYNLTRRPDGITVTFIRPNGH